MHDDSFLQIILTLIRFRIHQWPMNSWKASPFHDVIMIARYEGSWMYLAPDSLSDIEFSCHLEAIRWYFLSRSFTPIWLFPFLHLDVFDAELFMDHNCATSWYKNMHITGFAKNWWMSGSQQIPVSGIYVYMYIPLCLPIWKSDLPKVYDCFTHSHILN